LNLYALLPLLAVIAYIALITVIALRPLERVHKVFIWYMAVSALWSFCSFVLHAELFPTQTLPWNRALLVLGCSVGLLFYHFVRAFFNRPAGKVTYTGYAILVAAAIFVGQGSVLQSSYVVDGVLYWETDVFFYPLVLFSAIFVGMAIALLVQGIRHSTDPQERNRISYLLAAISIWILFALTNFVPVLANYSVDHIGNIAFALIISYTMLRYHLLDVRLVVRRSLAYSALFIILLAIYAGVILAEFNFFPEHPAHIIILLVASVAVLLFAAARPLRYFIVELVDRLFHRETYTYRQSLLSFSRRMGGNLSLDEVANEMLPNICKALRLTQAKLLFQEMSSGDFVTQFTYPPMGEGESDKLRFSTDNPISIWLTREGKTLSPEQITRIPQLKGLWATEKEKLASSGLGLLCPIKSRGRLVGILVLGKKQEGGLYSHEDINLVMSTANQAGIVIENAQLYTQATTRANTDGLTGLYNHRHFHERLEQEIARGSRFGTMFSLIMLDIDLFKTYNDIYGHLAGDQILRKLAEHLKESIRSLDMAFRYGGEEFTIILPETRIDDAYNVAERIRKRVERKMTSKSMPLTISLGVGTWPTDGATKEEIIANTDAAMYRAKQTGRNRTHLSSDIAKPEEPLTGSATLAQRGALSVIYALAATVDAKDHYTYGHSKKVSEYAVTLAEALQLPADRIVTIRAAALLHDIGKIGVPDSILNKQAPLTESEWAPIKEHPQLGAEILRHVVDLINCLPAILHHHEHYNGTGYPDGLKGEDIPLEARILAIADAYDAITSLRPYRQRLSSREALAELRRCAGNQFDPELVDIFSTLIEPTYTKELEIK
jgi:diguanylate cyclase (GGDEF)-like protein/putative nucleotidyltransferase with HDIG domain